MALNDVSIEIFESESVGIIGDNGAGKSTLLKMITGVAFPDTGEVTVNGTVAALLELTAGFALEMTGRENIYLRGYTLGLKDAYIRKIEEDIIDFLIRHTRLVPRDIIIICNELAKLNMEIEHEPTLNIQDWIKKVVLIQSSIIGDELISICAKNIKLNTVPKLAAQYEVSEVFTSDKYYHETTYHKLYHLLEEYKNQTIDSSFVDSLNKSAKEQFGLDVHLSDILWQNGLLGYFDDNNKCHFFAQKLSGNIILPKNKSKYVFRACVITKLQS